MNKNPSDILQSQQKYIQQLQRERPEFFVAEKIFTEEDALPKIGISGLDPRRPQGFLRLYPQDYIIEETRTATDNSKIEPRFVATQQPEGNFTLYADMVKTNISTQEALHVVGQALRIDPKTIGYAGTKDANAFTSQRIALPGVTATQAENMRIKNVFLTNLYYGKGTITPSHPTGNAFTIFVRTEKQISNDALIPLFKKIKESGFYNFYQPQRFGGLRLIGHHLGRQILRGDYEGAIRLFLTYSSEYDIKLIKEIKDRSLAHYGSWKTIKKIHSLMPHTFANELKVISYLEKRPKDFIGALYLIKDQTTLWIYAYASLLFNSMLSIHGNRLPPEIPLLLSNDPDDRAIYSSLLEADEIHQFSKHIEPFPFIQLKKRLTPTRVIPSELMFMSTSEGVICHFAIPKDVYANSLLMNIFKLQQTPPIPPWVKKTACDTKKYLQIGLVEAALEKII